MTAKEKLINKFLANPQSLKYRQIEKIILSFDFVKIEAKGSHKKFKHYKLENDLTIPIHNNDCKNFYKKQVANTLKTLI